MVAIKVYILNDVRGMMFESRKARYLTFERKAPVLKQSCKLFVHSCVQLNRSTVTL